jgi:hypothetical protein
MLQDDLTMDYYTTLIKFRFGSLASIPDTYITHVYRLTEEEESAPSGPPRTKNELLFDNSLIYDPDSIEMENSEFHVGQPNGDSCEIGSSSKQRMAANSVAVDDLNQIGTIMYDGTSYCRSGLVNVLLSLFLSSFFNPFMMSILEEFSTFLTLIGFVCDRCRMDEENTIVVQAIYTQSPLNEGSCRSIVY